MDLKKLIIEEVGFDPDNESDCLEAVKQDGYSIAYIKNPSEEIQLEAVKQYAYSIQNINNPSIEIQKAAIYYSGYDIEVIAMCPDWKEFEQEIIDNLMIKDIIE
jgi:pyruvate/2-oxoglutarate/acetoin dehydrogenase E1 component